jgi:hypothetical protein
VVVSVLVCCRFLGDGSWSAAVHTDQDIVAEATAGTGRALVTAVAAALWVLAEQWQRPIRVVHDLHADPRAFAVVALVEGFHDVVCHQLERALSA